MRRIYLFVIVAILISMLSECEFRDTVDLFKGIPSVEVAI